MRSRATWKRLCGVLLVAASAVACGSVADEVPRTAAVREDFRHVLVLRGRLAARETRAISAGTRGKISFMVPEGAKVAEGDVLFRLETADIEQELATALLDLAVAEANASKADEEARSETRRSQLTLQEKEAALELAGLRATEAEAALARRRRQVEAQLVPRAELAAAELAREQAQLSRETAAIDLERTQEELATRKVTLGLDRNAAAAQQDKVRSQVAEKREYLEKATVSAPAAGIIVHGRSWNGESWKVGDEIWRNTPVMELPDLGVMEVLADVNEVDVAPIAPGTPARVRVEALPDLVLDGSLREIAGLAKDVRDDEGRPTGLHVFAIKVALNAQDARLRPGMSARIELVVKALADVVVVPAAALRTDAQGDHVLSPRGRVDVVVAARSHERVVIESGLSEGDVVLLAPADPGQSGEAEQPAPSAAAAGPAAEAPAKVSDGT